MTTKYRFEHFAGMSACTMTGDDGGSAFVFCGIPGGTPRFQFKRSDGMSTRVDGAPAMDSHKAFKAFVLNRWADDTEEGN